MRLVHTRVAAWPSGWCCYWCLHSAVVDRVYALFKLPANATARATPINEFPPGTLFRVGLVRAVLCCAELRPAHALQGLSCRALGLRPTHPRRSHQSNPPLQSSLRPSLDLTPACGLLALP